VLPSLVLLMALSWLYLAYGSVPAIAGILYGIKPAVVAIVLHAAWRIGSRALKRPVLWVVAALAFVAIFAFACRFPRSSWRRLHRLRRRARRAEEFAVGASHGAAKDSMRRGHRRRDADAPHRALPLVAARADRRVRVLACGVRARLSSAPTVRAPRCRAWAGSSARPRC
jgi:hypothetical protein